MAAAPRTIHDHATDEYASAPSWWRPVLVFVVVAYLGAAALGWLQHALGIDVRIVTFVQASPTLGLAAAWLFTHRDFLALLPSDRLPPQAFARRLGTAAGVVIGYALLTLLLSAIASTLPAAPQFTGWTLAALLVLQMLGALGEELGWRGFLQPAFARKWGPLRAAVIVGIIWACWHLDRLADPIAFIGFAMTAIAMSFALAVFSSGALWQRGALAALIHWTMNIVLYLFTDASAMASDSPLAMLPFVVPPLALGLLGLFLLRRQQPVGSTRASEAPRQ